MPRVATTVLALTLTGVGSTPATGAELPSPKDSWIRVETSHFTLYSSAGESKTKEIGVDLEKLRAVLLLFKESFTANSPVPTYLFVFKSDSAFQPYKPRYQGKPISALGFFQPTSDGNYIALSAGWNTDPRPPIYHEYLHYFLHNNFPPQPVWYDEGLAEFYSTFRSSEREAQVGLPLERHVLLLREVSMLPLEKLFAVGHDSPEYNEQSKQGVFYAESWALVHYLMRGKPERKPQLGRFLLLLHQGRSQDEAFHEAFGTDYAGLLAELRTYVAGRGFPYTRFAFSELKVPTQTRTQPMSYEDTLGHLGDLLAHSSSDRLGDAEALFQAALARNPSHAGALGGMGFIRRRQGKDDEAVELLGKAVASGTEDSRTYFHFGDLLTRSLWKEAAFAGRLDPKQREALERARSALRKSLELNGDFAETHVVLGQTYVLEGDSGLDQGIRELETAVKMLPSRKDLVLELARMYDRKGESAKSEQLLRSSLGPDAEPILAQRRKGLESHDSIERVNKLLAEGKEDEAIATLERYVAEADGDVKEIMAEELKKLREGAARNRTVRQYNQAIALWNKRDLRRALDAFEKVAATAEDPSLAKAARQHADEIRRALPPLRGKPTPQASER